jgi:hypothetical protein
MIRSRQDIPLSSKSVTLLSQWLLPNVVGWLVAELVLCLALHWVMSLSPVGSHLVLSPNLVSPLTGLTHPRSIIDI